MESGKMDGTVVLNLMNGSEKFFALPPDKAVVAACEEFDAGGNLLDGFWDPPMHPEFKEYRLGYSCGEWIAYKDGRTLK